MFNKFDIFLFSFLLLLYIIINNIHFYFILTYALLVLYYIFKLYRYIRFESDKKANSIFKVIATFILHFLFSYFVIFDSNPIYYLFTFYLPFENFFRVIFIIMFHSFMLSKFDENKNCKENQLIIYSSSNENNVQIWNSTDFSNKKPSFFLSDIFFYLSNNRIRLGLLITSLIIIKIIIFYYNNKLWIFFNEKEKILPLSTAKKTKYYITACILNMEPIIEDYINEIKKVMKYLGEKNIIVSIVENGDSKDNTRKYLSQFKDYLNSKDIPNKFVLTHETEDPRNQLNITKKEKKYARIQYLAALRNRCFDFLYQIPNLDFDNLKVINFNDIVFSYEDVIKLLATNSEDYDVVCAMDYYFNFYDNWVSIDLDGKHLLKDFPYFVNKEGQDQYINKKPIRVFSCWNGIVCFNASALKNKKLEFRVDPFNDTDINKRLHQLKNNSKEIYESECTYFHIDMETLGFKKRFINSQVKVAYGYGYYYFSKYILPNSFEILFYFKNYFKSLTVRRNKAMSDLKRENIIFPSILYNWYKYRKLNDSNLL